MIDNDRLGFQCSCLFHHSLPFWQSVVSPLLWRKWRFDYLYWSYAIEQTKCVVTDFFSYNYICCNYICVGLSMGKIKWALWCWIVCYKPRHIFSTLRICHLFNPRSNSLFTCRTPERIWTVHLFWVGPVSINVTRWMPYDDHSYHGAELSYGHHICCWNPRLDDTKCRVLSVATRSTSCVLEISYVLYFIPQVCIARIVQKWVRRP